jgi:NTE family protein
MWQPNARQSDEDERAGLLRDQEIFASLDPVLRRRLACVAESIPIEGGRVLFEEGSESDALYIVVSGALTATRRGADGMIVRLSEIFAGETVGEMGVLTGDARTASVTALRDCDLLRVRRDELLEIVRLSPGTALAFARLVSRRLARAGRRDVGRGRPRSFAFVPTPGLSLARDLVGRLKALFESQGATVLVERGGNFESSAAALQALEAGHRHVLYLTEAEVSEWTRLALRQSDELVILADPSEPTGALPALACSEAQRPERRRHLVLVGSGRPRRGSTADRMDLAEADFVHHLRDQADEARLVRILTRRAVGVAFAGGGARAFAHVGVMRALAEAGVQPDIFVGTSMGAVVAAAHAAEWSHVEILDRMRSALAGSRPLGDLMWPWIALFKGERVRRLLVAAFGSVTIEDLPLPFACVTTDLSTASACLHRRGPVVDALRASVSIPGVFAPVLIDGHVHVDGAVVDNLPIAALRRLDVGPVIGLDIGRPLREAAAGPAVPGLLDVLWRTSTISGVATEDAYRASADLYLKPIVRNYGILDWRGFDRAIALGYEEAKIALARAGEMLDALRAPPPP